MSDTNKPKRADKIFNNSYHHGEKLKGDDYVFDSSLSADIDYASSYLEDIYETDIHIRKTKLKDEMVMLLDTNAELNELLSDQSNKKFNKDKINNIFKIIFDHFNKDRMRKKFMDPIYIFDMVANVSGLKYDNLFDLLDYKYKRILILELDKEFNILDSHGNVDMLGLYNTKK